MFKAFKNLISTIDNNDLRIAKERNKTLEINCKRLEYNLLENEREIERLRENLNKDCPRTSEQLTGLYLVKNNKSDNTIEFMKLVDNPKEELYGTTASMQNRLYAHTFKISSDTNTDNIEVTYFRNIEFDFTSESDFLIRNNLLFIPKGDVYVELIKALKIYRRRCYNALFGDIKFDYEGFKIENEFSKPKTKPLNVIKTSKNIKVEKEQCDSEIKQLRYKRDKIKYKRLGLLYLGNIYQFKNEISSEYGNIENTIIRVIRIEMTEESTSLVINVFRILEEGNDISSVDIDLTDTVTITEDNLLDNYQPIEDYVIKEKILSSVETDVEEFLI